MNDFTSSWPPAAGVAFYITTSGPAMVGNGLPNCPSCKLQAGGHMLPTQVKLPFKSRYVADHWCWNIPDVYHTWTLTVKALETNHLTPYDVSLPSFGHSCVTNMLNVFISWMLCRNSCYNSQVVHSIDMIWFKITFSSCNACMLLQEHITPQVW